MKADCGKHMKRSSAVLVLCVAVSIMSCGEDTSEEIRDCGSNYTPFVHPPTR